MTDRDQHACDARGTAASAAGPPGGEVVARAVAHLVQLVDAPSLSGDEEPAVAAAERVAADLALPCRRMHAAPGRDNLLVGHAEPTVLLCTHLDTVPPFIGARVEDGAVHGRGACDAKGIAVAMLYALAELRARGTDAGVACLLVVGEETDHAGAAAAARSALRPRHVVLGEPCGIAPARAQKGLLRLRVRARGRAGHSAYPELGASAVHRLVAALARLLAGPPLPAEPGFGETTVNVGTISGGLAANVIAPEAEALVLIRCAAAVDTVLAAARDLLVAQGGAEGVAVTELGRAEPLAFDAVGQVAGDAVPFNTDAHTLGPLGASMSLLGPGDMRCAHAPHERLAIADLAEGIAAYTRIVEDLLRRAAP